MPVGAGGQQAQHLHFFSSPLAKGSYRRICADPIITLAYHLLSTNNSPDTMERATVFSALLMLALLPLGSAATHNRKLREDVPKPTVFCWGAL